MDGNIELYNLATDQAETNNIASDHPDIAKKTEKIMKQNHQPAPPQVDIPYEQAVDLFIPGR